jgi:acetyltransferase-like isoleucine patch superfamily enzyme
MEQEQKNTIRQRLGRNGSSFANYRNLVVGDGGYSQFFLYELINFLCMLLKGKAGILMRKLAVPYIIGKVGKRISIGANCTFRNGKKVFIGDQVVLDDNVSLDVKPGDKSLVIGDRVHIGRRTILNCGGGIIDVGEDSVIGSFCRLGVLEGLSIGHHCVMGNRSCISGAAHSFSSMDIPIIQQPLTCKGQTTVGDFVTIGERVTLLDGVSIGNNVTILSDSLVIKNIADGLVVSGVPARVVP